MARFSPLSFFILLLFINAGLLLMIIPIASAADHEFRVGGPEGWRNLGGVGNVSETYNQWAKRNRFHIGDSVYFKYSNDSVLVVNRENYQNCNTTSPLLKFTDGNTTIRFDRYGYFYFISGQPDHCMSGQKLVIRVMVHPMHLAPGPAPFPEPTGGSESAGFSPSGEYSNGAWKIGAGSDHPVLVAGLTGAALYVMLFVV